MTRKALTSVLLFFLALGAASASAPGAITSVADSPDHRAAIEQTEDHLLLATSGTGVNWGCVGAIAALTVGGLAVGAATGSAGLALIGAFAPVAVVFCL